MKTVSVAGFKSPWFARVPLIGTYYAQQRLINHLAPKLNLRLTGQVPHKPAQYYITLLRKTISKRLIDEIGAENINLQLEVAVTIKTRSSSEDVPIIVENTDHTSSQIGISVVTTNTYEAISFSYQDKVYAISPFYIHSSQSSSDSLTADPK